MLTVRAGLLGLMAFLGGCAGPSFIVLKNPENGQIVECKSSTNGLSMLAETIAVRDCAQGYQAAGYQRMN